MWGCKEVGGGGFKYVWHESSLAITGLDYGYIRWKVQSNNWKDASGGTVSYLYNSKILSLCAQCLNYKVHTYTVHIQLHFKTKINIQWTKVLSSVFPLLVPT